MQNGGKTHHIDHIFPNWFDIFDIYIYIYIYIHTNFVCQVLMSKYIYKKRRHLFTKKLYFGFFQTFKDSIK